MNNLSPEENYNMLAVEYHKYVGVCLKYNAVPISFLEWVIENSKTVKESEGK